jgi:hypothetical protein
MQKFIQIFFILFILLSQVSYSQSIEERLSKADALFNKKKYPDALRLYQELLNKDEYFTPAMLLKMSFISEGMGEYAGMMYYLCLYYAHEPEQNVLDRIAEMSEKYKLTGYAPHDADYVVYWTRRYHLPLLFLSTLVLGAVVYYFYTLKKRGKEVLFPSIALTVGLGVLFYLYNYGYDWKRGIVKQEKILLMDAPSAAAKVVSSIGKGHSVQIRRQDDIWYWVRFGEKEGYVRSANVFVIE